MLIVTQQLAGLMSILRKWWYIPTRKVHNEIYSKEKADIFEANMTKTNPLVMFATSPLKSTSLFIPNNSFDKPLSSVLGKLDT